jgi:hypothetical protein
MSSLKSYFRKKHRYETQSDLKDMTPQEIVSINPKDVGSYIEQETGGIPLKGLQQRALNRLLAIKRQQKTLTNQRDKDIMRETAITSFFQQNGLDPVFERQVNELIINTDKEVMDDRLKMKDLDNRLRRLKNQPIIPDTEEEALHRRIQSLKAGKGKRKTVSKRKRREKKRKGRRTRRRV